MQFTTKVDDVDIFGIGLDVADESSCTEAIVNWEFEIEARGNRIKGFSFYATSITAFVTLVKYINDNENEEIEIEIDSSKGGWKLESETEHCMLADGVCPKNVQIDFKEKTIIVSF